MLEVAIVSIKCALRDDFPEFLEFYQERGWEKKPEAAEDPKAEDDGADFECEIKAAREDEENDA